MIDGSKFITIAKADVIIGEIYSRRKITSELILATAHNITFNDEVKEVVNAPNFAAAGMLYNTDPLKKRGRKPKASSTQSHPDGNSNTMETHRMTLRKRKI